MVIFGLVFSNPKAEPSDIPLRLGTNVWPGYEPLYLARELGYFDENSVALVEYLSASEVMRAFRNKSIEAAALTLDEVLTLLQNKVPIQIFLVTDISNGADAILAKPHIGDLSELAGKRIGVEVSALGAYLLSRAMEHSDVPKDNLQVIELEANEHEAAYMAGRIDAVVTFEPVRTKLIESGAKELFSSREIPGEIVDVLAIHRQILSENTAKVRAIVDAWFKVLTYFKQNPTHSAQIMSKRLATSPEEVLKSFRGLLLADKAKNRQLLSGDSPPLIVIAKRMQKVMLKNALLKVPVSFDHLLTSELLE